MLSTLQLAVVGLDFVDMVGADLGLGADDDAVEIAQGLAQLVGLIELRNDLVALLLQLGHGLLVHTVGNEYSHVSNLLLIIHNQ